MRYRAGLLLIWLLCAVAALVAHVWMLAAICAGSRRAWKIGIGFDQLANTAFGGDEDETISSRCWRYRDEQPYKTLRWLLDAGFGDGHCESAREAEMARVL